MNNKKRGRPLKPDGEKQNESLLVMVQGPEKEAFKNAAVLSGSNLSAWVRQRLRAAAAAELENAGKPIAFQSQREAFEKG